MAPSDAESEDDASAVVETGRSGQRLVCEGWLASHADAGTPGPHVRLRASDGQDLVLRTDQVPSAVQALTTVATRIDRAWAEHGDEYAASVVLRAPDPQDPDVVRHQRVEHLRFTQLLADHLSQVVRLLVQADSTDEALVSVGALLGVDEAEVMQRLARFDLLSLTRAAQERRVDLLAGLED